MMPEFHIHRNHNKFSIDLLTALHKIGKPRHVQRLESVMTPDTTNDFFFYINKGIFKTVRPINDREFILGFTFPGDVDGDPASLLGTSRTNFSIVAVADADITVCRWQDLEQEMKKEKYLATVNFFLARYVTVLQNRLIDSLAITAEDRYKQLVNTHVKHLNEIPVSDMAGYLGITKQSLSRIRNGRF
ncbi:MAG: Crp/Fnr family transcriptional regulator [Cyclobacteriaceae bacterium]|nr:Crp/Fnr family transcriptional regulator [Cyclobacteriaceae bacterium]UYN85317.1 MAG: Crp/Fnr family transcriptional regulator [Cyclobacteriaceae bacterium]